MSWEAACLPKRARCYVAGIGPERAKQAAQKAARAGAEVLISYGSAGGVDPSARSGSLWVTEHILGACQSATLESQRLRLLLAEKLKDLEPSYGQIVQCAAVLHSVADKQALFTHCRAQVADMESAAIASVAIAEGCAFSALRVVLDDATMAMPQSLVQACDEYGRVRPWVMAKALAVQPSLWPSLGPLARARARACKTLHAAGCMLVPD